MREELQLIFGIYCLLDHINLIRQVAERGQWSRICCRRFRGAPALTWNSLFMGKFLSCLLYLPVRLLIVKHGYEWYDRKEGEEEKAERSNAGCTLYGVLIASLPLSPSPSRFHSSEYPPGASFCRDYFVACPFSLSYSHSSEYPPGFYFFAIIFLKTLTQNNKIPYNNQCCKHHQDYI